MKYDFSAVEAKWKKKWIDEELYKVSNESDKPKFYVLDMFPYPSGAGLHVGHPLGYIASDIFSRYKRLSGYNVLHPMGFDAFGLPAEEYAIATGVHPAKSTAVNIERYKEQLANIGFSYDWSREVRTCDPAYYKWTQWIFTLLFEHYYDLDENKAKPISDLVAKLEAGGTKNVEAFTSNEQSYSDAEWKAMESKEQFEVLSHYRLAYRKVGFVNWCPGLGTVLANDQIKDGFSERGGHPVERKAMTQWYLRTTAYAERLLSGLENIDWTSSLKTIQRNWIGKSKGAQMFFEIEGSNRSLEIFTTRPDTIFGATYMVLAPEHPLVEAITTADQKDAISDYLKYVNTRTERDRMSDVKEVTGAFTGAYAVNPFNNKRIPIWIGEYVLMDYGTGAIMAVPSDDDRDHAFATKFDLEIVEVVDKSDFPGSTKADKTGVMINSDFLDGLQVPEAIEKMCQAIEEKGIGAVKINYKMRDAGFSRQRYWGEPFPVVYKDGVPSVQGLSELPVELPHTDDFKPTADGQSPLSRVEDWVQTEDGIRETDTMPAVAGSSWYFLRYMDPQNQKAFASKSALNYWKDVDVYVGGSEHAVAHLLYSRFWHKFLNDTGYVPTQEPFKKLINQGMIQGVIEYLPLIKEGENNVFVSYNQDDEEQYSAMIPVHIDFVSSYGNPDSHLSFEGLKKFVEWRPEYKQASFVDASGHRDSWNNISSAGKPLEMRTKSEVGKMSKRYYNVVNPDDVVGKYGADTFRLYEMFLGPIEQSKPWDTQGIEGVNKFIRRFWGLFFQNEKFAVSEAEATEQELKSLHLALKKVAEDIEKFSFNTAISAMMICVNELKKMGCNKRAILEPLTVMVAPFAPFMSEELWSLLGNAFSVHTTSFPHFEEKYLSQDSFEYPICINGKKRTTKAYPATMPKDEIEKDALAIEEVQKWIEGKNVAKIIVVPQRMVNIVVK